MRREADVAGYLVSVRPVRECPDDVLTFSLRLDEETVGKYGLRSAQPPLLEGELVNRAGVVFLEYRVSCTLLFACARCLSEVALERSQSFSHVVMSGEEPREDAGDYLWAPGDKLDLSEAAMTDIVLELPSKILCRPDCKGLCPVCGGNRNLKDCGCVSDAYSITMES